MSTTINTNQSDAAARILAAGKRSTCQCYAQSPPPLKVTMRARHSPVPAYLEICTACGKPGPVCHYTQEAADRWIAAGSQWYKSEEDKVREAEAQEKPKTCAVWVKLCLDPEWGLKVIAEHDRDLCERLGAAFQCGPIVKITCEYPKDMP